MDLDVSQVLERGLRGEESAYRWRVGWWCQWGRRRRKRLATICLVSLLVVFFLEDTAAAVAQAHVHLAALRVLEHGLTG